MAVGNASGVGTDQGRMGIPGIQEEVGGRLPPTPLVGRVRFPSCFYKGFNFQVKNFFVVGWWEVNPSLGLPAELWIPPDGHSQARDSQGLCLKFCPPSPPGGQDCSQSKIVKLWKKLFNLQNLPTFPISRNFGICIWGNKLGPK